MTGELKPCPFCGGKAKLDTMGLMCQNYVVYCTKCHAEAESAGSTAKAIELWNRRTAPGNKPLELEHVDCKMCQFLERNADEEPCRYCKGAYQSKYVRKPEGSENHEKD